MICSNTVDWSNDCVQNTSRYGSHIPFSYSVEFFHEIGVAMSRDDIELNFTTNPDDGNETTDIDEFLEVSPTSC